LVIFGALVHLIIALEISQALARFYSDAKSKADQITYASNALWFTLGTYTLFGILCYALAPQLTPAFLTESVPPTIFRVALLSIWSMGLFYLIQNQLRWQLNPRAYAIASLINTFVTIGSTIALVLIAHLGVVGVLWGQFIGNSVGAGLALYFARHSFRFTFDAAKLKEMLRFSIPLVPSGIGVFIALFIDRIAIKQLMSIADVGVFGVGYRLTSPMSLLMVGFQGALTPLVYTYYQVATTPAEIARIFRYFVALALLGWLGLSLFAGKILQIFATPAYYEAANVVPLLAAATLLSNMYIFVPGLTLAKKTKHIALINLSAATLNTVLNFTLIPIWGLVGAAMATCLSAACAFGAQMFYSQKCYFVPHRWRALGLGLIVAVGLAAIGSSFTLDPWAAWLVKLFFLSGAFFLLITAGLIEPADLKTAWRWLSTRIHKPGSEPVKHL
jgi:O-antigen/teichoic acid export membrane protein